MNLCKTTIATFALLTLTQIASGQECRNGVCQIPSPRTGSAQRPWNLNPFQSYHRPAQLPRLTDSRRLQATACSCPTCDCDGVYCDCGPNCPPHYQSRHMPAMPVSRDSNRPSLFRAAPSVRAPQPRARDYSAVSYPLSISWQSDFERAARLSQRTGRPLLVRVTADWCGHCQRMKQETFANLKIISDVQSGFIAVSLNADDNRELLQKMQVQSLPTMLVISSERRIIDRREGFQSAGQLSQLLVRHLQRAELMTGYRVAIR